MPEKQLYTKPEIEKIEKNKYEEKIERSAAQDKKMEMLSQVGTPEEIESKFRIEGIEEQISPLKDKELLGQKKQEELAALAELDRMKIDKIIEDNINKPDFKKHLSAINPEKIDAKAIEKGLSTLMESEIDLSETERLSLFKQALEYYADAKNFEHPLVWHSSGSFTLRNGLREGFKGGYGRVAGETSHFINKYEDKKHEEVQKGLSVTHPDNPSAEYFQQLFARLGAKKEELAEFLALDSEKLTDKRVIETFIQAYKNTNTQELKKYVADSLGQAEKKITNEMIDKLMKQKIEAITQRKQEAKIETIKKDILPGVESDELKQILLEEAEHPFPVFMSFDIKDKQKNLTTVSRGEKPVPHLPFEDRYYGTVNKEQISQIKVPISQIDKIKKWCQEEGIEPEIIPLEVFEVKRLIEDQIEK
ncbi:MAG: hypothetical protein GF365_00390 [Candidatus Buchananbacteria bacterium]|nr:hypothetical protein [Candidatus Buchananbacteria bacterium]